VQTGISPLHAGRIRDWTRITVYAEGFSVAMIIASIFLAPQLIVLSAIGPAALASLMFVLLALWRDNGLGILVTVVGMAGAAMEFGASLTPSPEHYYSVGPLFGAGTTLVGAWFIGIGAIARRSGVFSREVWDQAVRGGVGLVLIGVSWFIDDTLSLFLLLLGAILARGLGPLFKELRKLGLPVVAKPEPQPELI
jgi:hypothetical protein